MQDFEFIYKTPSYWFIFLVGMSIFTLSIEDQFKQYPHIYGLMHSYIAMFTVGILVREIGEITSPYQIYFLHQILRVSKSISETIHTAIQIVYLSIVCCCMYYLEDTRLQVLFYTILYPIVFMICIICYHHVCIPFVQWMMCASSHYQRVILKTIVKNENALMDRQERQYLMQASMHSVVQRYNIHFVQSLLTRETLWHKIRTEYFSNHSQPKYGFHALYTEYLGPSWIELCLLNTELRQGLLGSFEKDIQTFYRDLAHFKTKPGDDGDDTKYKNHWEQHSNWIIRLNLYGNILVFELGVDRQLLTRLIEVDPSLNNISFSQLYRDTRIGSLVRDGVLDNTYTRMKFHQQYDIRRRDVRSDLFHILWLEYHSDLLKSGIIEAEDMNDIFLKHITTQHYICDDGDDEEEKRRIILIEIPKYISPPLKTSKASDVRIPFTRLMENYWAYPLSKYLNRVVQDSEIRNTINILHYRYKKKNIHYRLSITCLTQSFNHAHNTIQNHIEQTRNRIAIFSNTSNLSTMEDDDDDDTQVMHEYNHTIDTNHNTISKDVSKHDMTRIVIQDDNSHWHVLQKIQNMDVDVSNRETNIHTDEKEEEEEEGTIIERVKDNASSVDDRIGIRKLHEMIELHSGALEEDINRQYQEKMDCIRGVWREDSALINTMWDNFISNFITQRQQQQQCDNEDNTTISQ